VPVTVWGRPTQSVGAGETQGVGRPRARHILGWRIQYISGRVFAGAVLADDAPEPVETVGALRGVVASLFGAVARIVPWGRARRDLGGETIARLTDVVPKKLGHILLLAPIHRLATLTGC